MILLPRDDEEEDLSLVQVKLGGVDDDADDDSLLFEEIIELGTPRGNDTITGS